VVRGEEGRVDVEAAYAFVSEQEATYPVTTICRVLGVSRSGYYDWRGRPPAARTLDDAYLTQTIKELHEESRQIYGAPRIHADLVDLEIHVGCKRVARLMREAGIRGVSRRKGYRTTVRSTESGAEDRVERDFQAEGPNELWVADITHILTWSGPLYLAVVIDVWSRMVVGWSMANHMRTELVLDALNMAITRRQPRGGLIHHSDHGSQYTSLAFGSRCEILGIALSMGSVGDCYDNALAESFFASLECELIDRFTFRDRTRARLAVFDYIESFYNPVRRHSALGQVSPLNFERQASLSALAA
jgi:putative transposase